MSSAAICKRNNSKAKGDKSPNLRIAKVAVPYLLVLYMIHMKLIS